MKYFLVFFLLFFSGIHADEYEEGIKLLQKKEYAQASKHFKQAVVLEEKAPAALFGKVLCEVALGKHEKASKHMEQVNKAVCRSCKANKKDAPIKSAEKISGYECRQKVRKHAQELRLLVEKMVADTVPGFFQKIRVFRELNPYIDSLERNGLFCCQNGQTAEYCIEPLVIQLELWNSEGLSEEANIKKDK
jgi:tetratricopeptide (TPR) repeat protein